MILGWFKAWFLLGAVLMLPEFIKAIKEKNYNLAISNFSIISLLCYMFWTSDMFYAN